MRRPAPSILLVAALGVVASCSKSDNSKHSGSAAPIREPGARGAIAGAAPGEGAMVPVDPGAPTGPDDSFQIESTAVAGPAGGENVTRVVVRPGKGFHMNKDYPTKLTLQLPDGVQSPKLVLEPTDAESFTETQLAFAVKLTAAGKGDYTIPATLKFAVCTDSTCNPKKQSIALSLSAH